MSAASRGLACRPAPPSEAEADCTACALFPNHHRAGAACSAMKAHPATVTSSWRHMLQNTMAPVNHRHPGSWSLTLSARADARVTARAQRSARAIATPVHTSATAQCWRKSAAPTTSAPIWIAAYIQWKSNAATTFGRSRLNHRSIAIGCAPGTSFRLVVLGGKEFVFAQGWCPPKTAGAEYAHDKGLVRRRGARW